MGFLDRRLKREVAQSIAPIDFASIMVRKLNSNHDEKGRFATGSALGSALDRKLIDYKPGRSLTDVRATIPISRILPDTTYTPYSKTPFFNELNTMQGVDPKTVTAEDFVAARGAFFDKLPVADVPLKNVVVTQPVVNESSINRIFDPKKASGRQPSVVISGGKSYILDGHHRAVILMMHGEKTMKAHVLDLDAKRKKAEGGNYARILKFNPNHDNRGQFASADAGGVTKESILAAAPAEHQAAYAAAEAHAATLTQTTDDPANFVDGKPTEARQAVHNAILSQEASKMDAAHVPGQQPTLIILGGRAGSGKSAFTNGTVNEFEAHSFYVVNTDHVQEYLPGYTPTGALAYHEEASALGFALRQLAVDKKANFVIDTTLKTSKNVDPIIAQAKAAGYRVEGHFMSLDNAKAASRTVSRMVHEGRFVPLEVALSNTTNEQTFDRLKPQFDKWSMYSNDVPKGQFPKKLGHS